jgi:Ca2+-binding RTX toxin-like protein
MRRAVVPLVFCIALALPAVASADVTATLQGTVVTVTGTDGPDTITISANGANVEIAANGAAPVDFPQASVTSVVVNSGAGDDTITGAIGLPGQPLTVDAGPGNDTITGGDGADTIHGGDGADTIVPSRANDTVFGDAGPDTMVWNPGDGSDTFFGGDGTDRLQFNGANVNEKIGLNAVGSTALLTRDVGNITETLQQVELLDLTLLGGTDQYTAGTGLAATGLQHVFVDGGTGNGVTGDVLSGGDISETLDGGGTDAPDVVSGGAGDDTLIAPLGSADTLDGGAGTDTLAVAGTNDSELFTVDRVVAGVSVSIAGDVPGTVGPATSVERVRIDALDGNDTVTLTPAAQAAVSIDADGGQGDDTLNGGSLADVLHGGAGDDVLRGGGGDDQLFGDAGDDVMFGGDGPDTFHCGGVGDIIDDAGPGDTIDADCLPPPAAVTVAPEAPPLGVPPTIPVALSPSAPAPVKGFAIVSVSATRTALSVKLRNTTASTLTVRVGATEHGHAYRSATKSLKGHATTTITLSVPASVRSGLAKALKHARKVTRKPTITVTNTATKASTKTTRTLSLKRSR